MEIRVYKIGLKPSDCRSSLLKTQISYKMYQAQKEAWSGYCISKEDLKHDSHESQRRYISLHSRI